MLRFTSPLTLHQFLDNKILNMFVKTQSKKAVSTTDDMTSKHTTLLGLEFSWKDGAADVSDEIWIEMINGVSNAVQCDQTLCHVHVSHVSVHGHSVH